MGVDIIYIYIYSEDRVYGSGRWVLDVDKKSPGSITFSLPLICAAKEVVWWRAV